jgi:16S rRNA (cytidine1402-2'-O)-methyltransferase
MSGGSLYLIATPIGNLADITLRALETLRTLDLVAAEDTRTAKKLLGHYQIRVPLLSLHDNSPASRLENLLERLARGENIGLISEAGTPGISDPGYRLVTAAVAAGVAVVPLPGPCAAVTALCASGLPLDSFYFAGFLPLKPGPKKRRLEGLKELSATLIFYESPRRLAATLEMLLAIFGDRPACVARELSKLYEEFIRLPLSRLIEHGRQQQWRGEITLLVAGSGRDPARAEAALEEREQELETRLAAGAFPAGLSRRDLVEHLVRDFPELKRRRIYELVNRNQLS